MYYDKLKEDLFVDIDYPKEITDLIGDAQAWKDFCKLSRMEKEKFAFMNHQEDADPGYRFRSRAEGREDKEYFHIYPEIPKWITEDGLTREVDANPTLKNFFEYADTVDKTAHDFALKIGREMGKEIPELLDLVEGGKIRSVLRMLHYTNTDETEVIAAQHFDRSLYTLHLYESAPGLQFLDWNMEWQDAPIANGKTVVFTGYRGEQLTKGRLQKTWHRVVKKGDAKDRISLVLFVWTNAITDYGREDRSQDLTPAYTRV